MASLSSPVLVGRDAELARLLDAVGVAAEGRPQLVILSGEAGIGKSRLLAEVVGRARADGSRILAGSCLDIGDGVPYLPLAEGLRGLARATPPEDLAALLGPTRDDLATIAPELAARFEPAPAAEIGSVGQARLFERVLELLGRLAGERPVVVVVEDVQWIDRATRDLVTFLVRNVTTEPVVAFLTVRTEDLPRGHPNLAWLAELGRAPGGVRVTLGPLDRAAVERQLAAIAHEPPEEAVVDRIWRRCEGNPFFAEELFAADDGADGAASSLVQILLARLRAVDEPTRQLVAALAVAARAVDERLLAAAVGRTVAEIRPSLREAIERHLVREEPGGAVRVRHELLREVVEDELLAGERRTLHERFAEAITADPSLADPSPATAAAEIARHWDAAARIPEAWAAAVAAARAAEAVHAHVDAHREYERACSLEKVLPVDARPDATVRLEIRRRAGEAADLAGAFERAVELTREALGIAQEIGDSVQAGLLHARLGYLLWTTGDQDRALDAHREAVRLVPADPPSAPRARVLAGLAGVLLEPGGYDEAASLAGEAIRVAEEVGAPVEEARARNVLGFALVALGRPDAGLDELRRSRDLARADGPPDVLVVAHYNLALNLAEAGLLEEALEEAQAGREAARRTGLERRFGFDLAALAGDALLRLGRWDEADAVTAEALRLDRADRGSPFLAGVRGRLEALRGQTSDARRRFAAAAELGSDDDADTATYVATGRAEAELADGRPAEALEAAGRALAAHGPSHALFVRAPLLALGLRAAADLAERARAGRESAALVRIAELAEPFNAALASLTQAPRAAPTAAAAEQARLEQRRLEAALSGAADEHAADAWAALAERFDGLGEAYATAYARWRSGEAELRARGTRGEAERRLRLASAAATRLGATPLSVEIVALARRARVNLEAPVGPVEPRLAPDADEPPDTAVAALRRAGLSTREIEVLRLVAAGRTNGQIAEQLFITRKTAGVHVTHILDKLNVSNRVEAAMVAARLGLETEPDDDGG